MYVMVRAFDAHRRASAAVCSAALLSLCLVAPAIAAEEAASSDAPPSAAAVEGSTTAQAWIPTELGDVRGVASGVMPFVAVGSAGFPPQAAAWSSSDGLAWESSAVTDAPAGTTMTAVVATDDGFVALGHESTADGGEADQVRAWHSTDGLTWEPANVERPARSKLQAAVAGAVAGPGSELVLGSFIGQDIGAQRLWRSTDGQEWTPVPLPGAKRSVWHSVEAVPDGFLLVGQGSDGKTSNWHSTDGLTWKRLKSSPRLFDVASSATGETVGIGAKTIWLSPDLRSWEKVWTRPRSWKAGGSNAFEWVAWDGSEFLVAGRDLGSCAPDTDECQRNPLLVSSDGRSWTEAAGPDGQPGADEATWLEGSASSDSATIIEGQAAGSDVVWLVEGPLAADGATD
jgi:hypothetical protein